MIVDTERFENGSGLAVTVRVSDGEGGTIEARGIGSELSDRYLWLAAASRARDVAERALDPRNQSVIRCGRCGDAMERYPKTEFTQPDLCSDCYYELQLSASPS